MAIIKWRKQEPFLGSIFDVQDEINKIFDVAMGRQEAEGGMDRFWSPAVDVAEDKNSILVKAELPGMKQEDIKVEVEDDVLTIRGERKMEHEEKDKHYHRVERSYGVFQRALRLPAGVDTSKVSAQYTHGVLNITLPKKEEAKKKSIAVEVK